MEAEIEALSESIKKLEQFATGNVAKANKWELGRLACRAAKEFLAAIKKLPDRDVCLQMDRKDAPLGESFVKQVAGIRSHINTLQSFLESIIAIGSDLVELGCLSKAALKQAVDGQRDALANDESLAMSELNGIFTKHTIPQLTRALDGLGADVVAEAVIALSAQVRALESASSPIDQRARDAAERLLNVLRTKPGLWDAANALIAAALSAPLVTSFDYMVPANRQPGQWSTATRAAQGFEVSIKSIACSASDTAAARQRAAVLASTWAQPGHLDHVATLVGIAPFASPPFLVFSTTIQPTSFSAFVEQRPERHLELLCDVATGLANLHAHDVVHGCLRTSEILITSSSAAALFPTAVERALAGTYGVTLDTDVPFLAPELLAKPATAPTTASDVFAFGMIALEILGGARPAPGQPSVQPTSSPTCSAALWNMISAGWTADPARRPAMANLVAQLRSWLSYLTGSLFRFAAGLFGMTDPFEGFPRPTQAGDMIIWSARNEIARGSTSTLQIKDKLLTEAGVAILGRAMGSRRQALTELCLKRVGLDLKTLLVLFPVLE
ncbi:hypothetical protein H9P43_004434 [Blastocladiella emersonii ATCC 22665]|nr:hypothetical protein H9P43_004434 [Blastocladiella emersonii ATCC 22665]